VLEYLPSKHEALSSKNEKESEREREKEKETGRTVGLWKANGFFGIADIHMLSQLVFKFILTVTCSSITRAKSLYLPNWPKLGDICKRHSR
jgi:hypothetical protein